MVEEIWRGQNGSSALCFLYFRGKIRNVFRECLLGEWKSKYYVFGVCIEETKNVYTEKKNTQGKYECLRSRKKVSSKIRYHTERSSAQNYLCIYYKELVNVSEKKISSLNQKNFHSTFSWLQSAFSPWGWMSASRRKELTPRVPKWSVLHLD